MTEVDRDWLFVGASRPSLAGLLSAVTNKHGLTAADLKGDCRARHIAWPRQEFMALARLHTSHSLPAIGRYLGGRDHTTVLSGIRAHQARNAG